MQFCIPSLQLDKPRHIDKSHPFLPSPSRLLRSRLTFCIVLHGMALHTPIHIAGFRLVSPALQPFEASHNQHFNNITTAYSLRFVLVTQKDDAGTTEYLFSFLYTPILVSSSGLSWNGLQEDRKVL